MRFVTERQLNADFQGRALKSDSVQILLIWNKLTYEQLKESQPHHCRALEDDAVYELFRADKLTADQLLTFEPHHCRALEDEDINDLFYTDKITADQFLHFSGEQCKLLEKPTLQRFISGGHMLFSQPLQTAGKENSGSGNQDESFQRVAL